MIRILPLATDADDTSHEMLFANCRALSTTLKVHLSKDKASDHALPLREPSLNEFHHQAMDCLNPAWECLVGLCGLDKNPDLHTAMDSGPGLGDRVDMFYIFCVTLLW